jgi:beta-glucanase (GH16 family)
MENVNNATNVHGTLHCGVTPGGPCNEKTGRSATKDLGLPAGQAGMHTYAVVWETAPQRLIWSVDGVPYFQLTPKDLGQATWDATFNHGYFLLLNLAVGGDWPGYPNRATVAGASMLVDWIRVSKTI